MNASSVDDPASSSGGETEGEASKSDGGAPPTQPAATQPSAAKLTASSVEVAASDEAGLHRLLSEDDATVKRREACSHRLKLLKRAAEEVAACTGL